MCPPCTACPPCCTHPVPPIWGASHAVCALCPPPRAGAICSLGCSVHPPCPHGATHEGVPALPQGCPCWGVWAGGPLPGQGARARSRGAAGPNPHPVPPQGWWHRAGTSRGQPASVAPPARRAVTWPGPGAGCRPRDAGASLRHRLRHVPPAAAWDCAGLAGGSACQPPALRAAACPRCVPGRIYHHDGGTGGRRSPRRAGAAIPTATWFCNPGLHAELASAGGWARGSRAGASPVPAANPRCRGPARQPAAGGRAMGLRCGTTAGPAPSPAVTAGEGRPRCRVWLDPGAPAAGMAAGPRGGQRQAAGLAAGQPGSAGAPVAAAGGHHEPPAPRTGHYHGRGLPAGPRPGQPWGCCRGNSPAAGQPSCAGLGSEQGGIGTPPAHTP